MSFVVRKRTRRLRRCRLPVGGEYFVGLSSTCILICLSFLCLLRYHFLADGFFRIFVSAAHHRRCWYSRYAPIYLSIHRGVWWSCRLLMTGDEYFRMNLCGVEFREYNLRTGGVMSKTGFPTTIIKEIDSYFMQILVQQKAHS